MVLIGIDSAVDSKNVGVARGRLFEEGVLVEELASGAEVEWVDRVVDWTRAAPNALLAIDAPLGWPASMRAALAQHRAGDPIDLPADSIFRRETDLFVQRTLRQRPLDIGADRIARTAHAALAALFRIREGSGKRLPLAWAPGEPAESSAIEVYPAATLRARGLSPTGYKKEGKDGWDRRAEILVGLKAWMHWSPGLIESALGLDHLFDAALCVLAAADFVRGDVLAPEDPETARIEGWIWVRRPRA